MPERGTPAGWSRQFATARMVEERIAYPAAKAKEEEEAQAKRSG